MTGIIQLLPDHVANQIAAGEVVQRPASVVKELLENAVDAKAQEIRLLVKDAGKALVQVIDNGTGMSPEDARRCFERHATSKIKQAEDLFDLHTKGFRGEALASIAAISRVELRTRRDQDEIGTQVYIEGSRFTAGDPAVLPKGTSFSVRNLFFNIPARRNFLKSDIVEYRHVLDEFQRVALAHPEISFSLDHNGSESFRLPVSNLRQRIVGILGTKSNEKLVPLQEQTAIASISGFIGKPEFAKKGRGEQYFFVNGRYIRNGYLHHSVLSAYEGLLRDDCQPSYFIYLEVPPHTIDINIHPTKTEVKFDDEQALYAILRATVKHSLGQFNISPVLDFNRDASLDVPYDYGSDFAQSPLIDIDPGYNPFGEEKNSSRFSAVLHRPVASGWEALYSGLDIDYQVPEIRETEYENEAAISSLFEENQPDQLENRSYQIHRKYIVNPIKSGMVIVDQQRAHQRVLYEQFLGNMTVKHGSGQQLLFPLELFFSVREMEILSEIKPSLETTGFAFKDSGSDHWIIEGIPVNMTESEVSIVLEQLLGDIENGVDSDFSQNDGIAKSMAKSLAVKTGTVLNLAEQQNLVNGLFACRESQVSPFGRPTYVTMRVEDIDKKFSL